MVHYKNTTNKISVFGLAMLNVAAVLSLRGLPLMAETGLQMFFYLFFASFLFLIPCSLVAAELASGWPEEGGVYRWVKEAFGSRWGMLAISLQWIQNIIWYPVILAFAGSAFAYGLNQPDLANNNLFLAGFIVTTIWLTTLLTFRGIRTSEKLTSLAVLFGTIIPVIVIIGFGLSWILMGNRLALFAVPQSILPDFTQFNNIAFLAGIVLLFAGMEVGAVHVKNLQNPRTQYPKAIFIATLIIIVVFSLGSFAVAVVLPKEQISLTAGIMQTFQTLLTMVRLDWLLPLLGLLVAFGAMGGVIAWILGPSKGLLATAKCGEIPPALARINKNGIQTTILMIQATLVTLLTSLYLMMENVSIAFFLLTAMSISLYLIVYLLMFLAALRLRYSQPDVYRAYTIPGGNAGMWGITLIGTFSVSYAFIVAFFPPAELHVASPKLYVGVLITGLMVFCALPLILHTFKKQEWQTNV